MGMLRGLYEVDGVAALEIKKATGTVRVDGQTCTLASYRASIKLLAAGMRAQYSCTTPDGRMRKAIEVVSGNSRGTRTSRRRAHCRARARDPEAQCAHRAADPDLERAAGSGQGGRSSRCQSEGHDGGRQDGRDPTRFPVWRARSRGRR